MAKYRKLPVVIDAVQWTGNIHAIDDFVGDESERLITPGDGNTLSVHTLEGVMTANRLDYIIRGVRGELYPCKPDIFESTYEAV